MCTSANLGCPTDERVIPIFGYRNSFWEMNVFIISCLIQLFRKKIPAVFKTINFKKCLFILIISVLRFLCSFWHIKYHILQSPSGLCSAIGLDNS